MPHPWDETQYAHYSWLPWQEIDDSNLLDSILAYYKLIYAANPDIKLALQDGIYYLAYNDKKITIVRDNIIPPGMIIYLNIIQDLPKLKKISESIEKVMSQQPGEFIDLSLHHKKANLLFLSLFFHHLLGADQNTIAIEAIENCLKCKAIQEQIPISDPFKKKLEDGREVHDIDKMAKFLAENFSSVQKLFREMQVKPQQQNQEQVVILTAPTGNGVDSQATAIQQSIQDHSTTTAETFSVAASQDMGVLKSAFGEPFLDIYEAFNYRASTDEIGKLNPDIQLNTLAANLLGIPRFLEFSRKKLWDKKTSHLISCVCEDKPSRSICALSAALHIPMALFANDYSKRDSKIAPGLEVAAETTRLPVCIFDPEEGYDQAMPPERYTVTGCPTNSCFKKLEPHEITTIQERIRGNRHETKPKSIIGITLGGLAHIATIISILEKVPSQNIYVIALANNATPETKAEILKIAAERNLTIKFADEVFEKIGQKLPPEEMNKFYNACNFVITKPGGSTTVELEATGTPAVLITIGGHKLLEQGNLHHLTSKYPKLCYVHMTIDQLTKLPILQHFSRKKPTTWSEQGVKTLMQALGLKSSESRKQLNNG